MPGPSPFRLTLLPHDGPTKSVECPRSIQKLDGVKRYAKQWAGNVGLKGSILVSESGKDVALGVVASGVITKWM